MKANGIQKMTCKIGEKYNKNAHQIKKKVTDPRYKENTISEIFEEGYKMKETILDFIKVAVANYKELS